MRSRGERLGWMALVTAGAAAVATAYSPASRMAWAGRSVAGVGGARGARRGGFASPASPPAWRGARRAVWIRSSSLPGGDTTEPLTYAVLVDAENAQVSKLNAIMDELGKFGIINVRRVYGDFSDQSLKGWKSESLKMSFTPVNSFAYTKGKGTTDSKLIIQAMDLLHTNPSIDGFALVSSDSDFTTLAQRLRESGKRVLGFGESKTPDAFRQACNQFLLTENLESPDSDESPKNELNGKTSPNRVSSNTLRMLKSAVEDISPEGDGWAPLGRLKETILARRPDFDTRSYGFRKFSSFFRAHPDSFELTIASDKTTVYIRVNNRERIAQGLNGTHGGGGNSTNGIINGHTNGTSHAHANGHANGLTNGHATGGHATGHASGSAGGWADI